MVLSNDELKLNFSKLKTSGKLRDYEFEGSTLKKYLGRASDLVLPNCFTDIAEGAFEKNGYLRGVTIPESYINIGAKAFFKCINLNTVEFGKNIYSIGDSAFACCGLWHLVIPSNIINVGKLSFGYNEKLRIIEIEGSNTWFDRDSFDGCNGVESIAMPKNLLVGNIGLDFDKIEIQYK